MSEINVLLWAKDGCSYCQEVKQFFAEQEITYEIIDVTNHDDRRDILELKYGIRYVPVVEIGKDGTYSAITELGLEALKNKLTLVGIL